MLLFTMMAATAMMMTMMSSHCCQIVAAFVYPQPGFSSLGDGFIPEVEFPSSAAPSANGQGSPISKFLASISPNGQQSWTALTSPVINDVGNQYWAVWDQGYSVKIAGFDLNGGLISSIDLPGDHPIQKSSDGNPLSFLALADASRSILTLVSTELTSGSPMLKVVAVQIDSKGAMTDIPQTLDYPSSSVISFNPILTADGSLIIVGALGSNSAVCALQISITGQKVSAICPPIPITASTYFEVSLADSMGNRLLLSADGKGYLVSRSSLLLPSYVAPLTTPLTSSQTLLRAIDGGKVLAMDRFDSLISLYSANFNAGEWKKVWQTTIPNSNGFVPGVIDTKRSIAYLCSKNNADDSNGHLVALSLSSGIVLWDGVDGAIGCSEDSALLDSKGNVLVVSEAALKMSLISITSSQGSNLRRRAGPLTTSWSVDLPTANAGGASLDPVVWKDANGVTNIYSGGGGVSVGGGSGPGSGGGTGGGPTGTSSGTGTPRGSSSSLSGSIRPSGLSSQTGPSVSNGSGITSPTSATTGGVTEPPPISSGLSSVALVFIVIGVIAVLVVFAAVVLVQRRKRTMNQVPASRSSSTDNENSTGLVRTPAPLQSPLPPPTNSGKEIPSIPPLLPVLEARKPLLDQSSLSIEPSATPNQPIIASVLVPPIVIDKEKQTIPNTSARPPLPEGPTKKASGPRLNQTSATAPSRTSVPAHSLVPQAVLDSPVYVAQTDPTNPSQDLGLKVISDDRNHAESPQTPSSRAGTRSNSPETTVVQYENSLVSAASPIPHQENALLSKTTNNMDDLSNEDRRMSSSSMASSSTARGGFADSSRSTIVGLSASSPTSPIHVEDIDEPVNLPSPIAEEDEDLQIISTYAQPKSEDPPVPEPAVAAPIAAIATTVQSVPPPKTLTSSPSTPAKRVEEVPPRPVSVGSTHSEAASEMTSRPISVASTRSDATVRRSASVTSSGYAGSISSNNLSLPRHSRDRPNSDEFSSEDVQEQPERRRPASGISMNSDASSEYSGVAGPQWFGRGSGAGSSSTAAIQNAWWPQWKWGAGASAASKKDSLTAKSRVPPLASRPSMEGIEDDAHWRQMVLGDRRGPAASARQTPTLPPLPPGVAPANPVSPAQPSLSDIKLMAAFSSSSEEEVKPGTDSDTGFATAPESMSSSKNSMSSRGRKTESSGAAGPAVGRKAPSISSIGSYNTPIRPANNGQGVSDAQISRSDSASRRTGGGSTPSQSDGYITAKSEAEELSSGASMRGVPASRGRGKPTGANIARSVHTSVGGRSEFETAGEESDANFVEARSVIARSSETDSGTEGYATGLEN